MLLILLVGIVQSVSTGLRRYIAFELASAGRDRPAHEARRAFATPALRVPRPRADRSAHGDTRTPTSSRFENVILLIPLTIVSTLTMIAVIVILFCAVPVSRCSCSWRCPCCNLRRPVSPIGCSRSGSHCKKSCSELSGVVEESVTGIRVVKGFGAEGLQRPARHRGRQRLRPLDRHGEVPRQLPSAHRSASDPRARGHPLVRRPPGPAGQPHHRRHRRRELLCADADLAAAHARHAAWSVVAFLPPRPAVSTGCWLPIPRLPTDETPAPARRSGRGSFPRRALRLRARAAGARRSRPGDPAANRSARRGDGIGQVDDRPPHPALLRHRRRSGLHRRCRCARRTPPRRPARGRPRVRGHVPLLRECAGQHRLRGPQAPMEAVVRAATLAGARSVRDASSPTDTTR